MDVVQIVAIVFLIASWVLAVVQGGRPSPLDCAVWSIAVLAVFRGISFG